MKELIDKAAVVVKIKKLRQKAMELYGFSQFNTAYNNVLESIDTIETKEVDLDESARHYLLHEHISPLNEVLHQADIKVEMQYHKDIKNAYKAGFELGLKYRKESKL